MNIRRKKDAAEISAHLDTIPIQFRLGESRSWWPRFIYHFTDLENVISILESGQIMSRAGALAAGKMQNDNASRDIIENTSGSVKGFARFYFRPRTPTQYRNEGLRPVSQRELNSHCPVPVYFLLDAKEVLTRDSVYFTEGNAKSAPLLHSAEEFSRLPFDLICHDSGLSYYGDYEKGRIIYHRHAEVLVPESLQLTHEVVRFIWCRSPAEHATLLNMLSPKTHQRWAGKIGQGPKLNLFFNRWSFVQTASLSDQQILLRFNPNSCARPEFSLRVAIEEHKTGITYEWSGQNHPANGDFSLNLRSLRAPESYSVRCFLDDHLVYFDHHSSDDEIPF